jgi:hypothetical protein
MVEQPGAVAEHDRGDEHQDFAMDAPFVGSVGRPA